MLSQLLHASQWCWRHRMKRMASFFEKVMMLTCSAHISGRAEIAPNVSFAHGGIGVIVNPAASIGEGTVVDTHVVIGNRYPYPGCPKIGRNVYIGAGAKILGGVTISDNVKIGANAVVITDVAEGCSAVGIPAKIIWK